jgi:hypothetical protein
VSVESAVTVLIIVAGTGVTVDVAGVWMLPQMLLAAAVAIDSNVLTAQTLALLVHEPAVVVEVAR